MKGREQAGSETKKREFLTVAEWHGVPIERFTASERQRHALEVMEPNQVKLHPKVCPFRGEGGSARHCLKQYGVCSLRRYETREGALAMVPVAGERGLPQTICPHRYQERWIAQWIGEVMLGDANPRMLAEMPLKAKGRVRPLGNIDAVLVHSRVPSTWCAVERQAVYFSGNAMSHDLDAFRRYAGPGVPVFTGEDAGRRNLDYRSSGPKRMLPQLWEKVPMLSRWGHKLAVVVDRAFYQAMGEVVPEESLSQADLAFFIVQYEAFAGELRLVRDRVVLATMKNTDALFLSGAGPSMELFEAQIKARLALDELA